VEDFLFVLRTFAVTVVLFLLMQIRVGSATVEQHSIAWMHSSSVVDTLQEVADGTVHIFHLAGAKIQKIGQKAFGSKESTAATRVAKHRAPKKSQPVVAQVQSETQEPTAPNEPRRGTFRSFFDVKSVHDASVE
jgi:hypothetical protein